MAAVHQASGSPASTAVQRASVSMTVQGVSVSTTAVLMAGVSTTAPTHHAAGMLPPSGKRPAGEWSFGRLADEETPESALASGLVVHGASADQPRVAQGAQNSQHPVSACQAWTCLLDSLALQGAVLRLEVDSPSVLLHRRRLGWVGEAAGRSRRYWAEYWD